MHISSKERLTLIISLTLISCSILSSCSNQERNIKGDEDDIRHGIIYFKEGRFAAWPAKHGIWTWDNEIMVGFTEARHKETTGHTLDRITSRIKYARSQDGGLTWVIEDGYEHGQTGWSFNNQLPDDKAEAPLDLKESIDFKHPDFAMTFLRANNSTGPSHFYYTYDRGKLWKGPFSFPNLDTRGVATRTDYIIDGKHELVAFITVAKSNEREGRIACVKTSDGGITWERVSWIGPEPEGWDIMSSSLRISSTEMLTVIRTRKEDGHQLLTSYFSEDNGETWERLRDPLVDTGRGGSPPALVQLNDGRLALGYIYRSQYGSRVNIRFSSDNGRTWSDEIVLRCGDGANSDVGYPRMVQRPDGKLVLIYYWNNIGQKGAKPYRYIASTTFDPATWK